MSKGRVTVPTDENFVEGTKKYVEKWGADAVRDCDGTELPANAGELAEKVYKTYFIVRSDNDFAYAHDEYLQNMAIISQRYTAFSDRLEIDLLKDVFAEQVRVNTENYKKYWQVFDRTTGEEVHDWEYIGNNIVVVNNAKKMHEYTVSYFGKNLWDATQVYNYICNGWTVTKDRDIDPIFPEALEQILNNIEKWMKENPQVNVIRFTTFLYHFYILYTSGTRNQLFDWYNYATAASPAMFERFEKEYGYEIKLEDLITEGYYGNHFLIPTKAALDFRDLVQRFVTEVVAKIIEKVHDAGKEAMMFWGDSWMGAEPYGKYFADMKLDAIVGSAASGASVRIVTDIPNSLCKELRLNPYFFPDTLPNDETATRSMRYCWGKMRRALMRKTVDRIGFGGYLSIADKFPRFCDAVEALCDEFREIHDIVAEGNVYTPLKVAVMSYWGKEKSWMTNMISQDNPYQRTASVMEFLESLSGLPVDVEFISFEDAKNGCLKDFDVVFNSGNAGTAFSGDACWTDAKLLESVREYIANGGGFIGINEPSAIQYGGRYFQLADALGVDEERGTSILFNRYNVEVNKDHFVTEDVVGEIDYAGGTDHVYALSDGAQILDAKYEARFPKSGRNNGHVKLAVNTYGKGRTLYAAGLRYNDMNTRLLYRAILWCAGKEDLLKKAFSTNIYTECHYYPGCKKYAIINNTTEEQKTTFYDINGNASEYVLAPDAIVWINE